MGRPWEVITHRNALPFITGTICSHRCRDKCMRNAYEESVYIRTQKLKAAEGGFSRSAAQAEGGRAGLRQKVAVIGGGPAGMSAAYFLGRAGVDVTIFERKDSLGGIVRHVIPAFRIPASAIDNDVKLMEAMGAKVVPQYRGQERRSSLIRATPTSSSPPAPGTRAAPVWSTARR